VTPQPAELPDPPGVVVDHHRVPGVPAGTDHPAVPAGVVHVRDADAVTRVEAAPRCHETAEPPSRLDQPAELGRGDRDEVVARQVGARVRARPGKDHRVPAGHQFEVGVVPPTAQVVARLIVRREHHPARVRETVVVYLAGAVEVDRHLLPVGLVLVDAAEARTPVVERVEVPVLQHDPVLVPKHAPVVRGFARVEVVALQEEGPGRRATRNAPAEHERQPVEGVHQAGEEADGGQPAAAVQSRRALGQRDVHAVVVRRAGDDARERLADPRSRGSAAQVLQRERAGLGAQDVVARPRISPERGPGHVALRRDREEELALGVAHHGFERPEQGEVVSVRHGAETSAPAGESGG